MDKETRKEISVIWDKINEMSKSLSNYTCIRVDEITPYTETKTAYIGDAEVTFYTDVTGNLTVYFPYEYTVERLTDRIIITFEPLEEVTDITISIL